MNLIITCFFSRNCFTNNLKIKKMNSMKTILLSSIFCFIIYSVSIFGQSAVSSDSLSKYSLTEIVVTADKFTNELFSSASSVNKLNKMDIKQVPVNELIELFNYMPGYYISNLDGLGKNPIISTRGFLGGGETEYVSVFLDGNQINDLQSGLVNWNFINTKNIDNMEIVKGGASPLYGDAAMGGVINISSSSSSENYRQVDLSAGSFGSYGLSFISNDADFIAPYNVYAGLDNTDGFRKHSNWQNYSLGGNISISTGESSSIKISTNNQFLKSETPGPLNAEAAAIDRSFSLPYFKFDTNDEDRFNFGLIYKSNFSDKSYIDLSLTYNHSDFNNVRTFINSTPIIDPDTFAPIGVYDTTYYGDTKRNIQKIDNINSGIKYYSELPSINTRVVMGAELDYGSYNNKFYDLFSGFYSDYENNSSNNEVISSDGEGNRFNGSAFVNTAVKLLPNLDLFMGIRYDYIIDKYDSFLPDTSLSISNSAISPKIGINYKYSVSKNYAASIYLNVNRSFKAPSINQLVDFKQLNFGIFIPAGPGYFFQPIQAEPFGNSLLKPQKSLNFEIGTYQMLQFSPNLSGELSLAVYNTDVKDEIDFDLNTYKYGNINESLHQGIEAGFELNYKSFLGLFINYTYTKAEFKTGNYKNNQLKGIPEHFISGGILYNSSMGLSAALTMRALSDIFIDDENINSIPGYVLYDTQIAYKYKIAELKFKLINIFDTKFNSSGYVINGGQFLFTDAGRFISAELVFNF